MPHLVPTPARARLAAAIALCCLAPAAGAVTITVDSGGDDPSFAVCSLRNAITAINYGNAVLFAGCRNTLTGLFGDNDTVKFAPALANSTITLQQGQISNYAPLTIAGSGQTIDAGGASRVLYTIAFLKLSNLTLSGGNARNANGGGLLASQAYVSLDNVTVTANRCAGSGSGVSIESGSAKLTNARLTGNASSGGHGGALFVGASNVALLQATIADNSAACSGSCGGGIASSNGSVAITASTLARNSASTAGMQVAGALYSSESKIVLINSTIAGNTASGQDGVAGALLENQSSTVTTHGVTLTNVTVSANTATTANAAATWLDGGILIGTLGTGRATINNSIVAANGAAVSAVPAGAPDFAAVTGSVAMSNDLLGSALQASYPGNGNVFTDAPQLAALADRGGPTETMALIGGSPAIDAGSNALAVNASAQPLGTDQRGSARIVNGSVDIGAYEFPGDHIFGDSFGP